MAYKNDIGRKLKIAKYSRTSRTYKLKHELDYKMGFLQKVKFCFSDKPLNSLNIMSKYEIEDYIDKYYIKANSIKKEYLISDLIACKSYKDSLEFSFKLDEFLLNCIAIFTAIIAIMIAVILTVANTEIDLTIGYSKISGSLISGANKSQTVLNGRYYLIAFVILIFWFLIKWFSEAIPTNKIRSLNNAIYILESIKEDIDKNPIEIPETREFDIEVDNVVDQVSEPRNYPGKVKESLEDTIELLDEKNKKEYLWSIMETKLFEPYRIEVDGKGVISYKDSNDKKNDLTTKSKENLASYINDKYCNVNKQSREDILKDLAIFKNLRKTLELEYRSYEAFIKNVAFIIAILSFAITSTKDMIPLNELPCVATVIVFASLAYLLGTGIYLVKIVDRKSGPGKLDVIEYGINVLEIKLKELDEDQDE